MVRFSHKLTMLGAVAVVSLGMTGTVFARNGVGAEGSPSVQPSSSVKPSVRPVETSSQAERAKVAEAEQAKKSEAESDRGSKRLDAAKLNVCEKKTKHVAQVMTRITERATAQLAVFTKISDRTQAFYTAKGHTVAGYDALVAAAAAAKLKAQTDITALSAADAFACNSADPKGSVADFKLKVKLVVADLKAYRTAVKNLIVAVKSVQPVEVEPSTSASPSTVVKPTATQGAN